MDGNSSQEDISDSDESYEVVDSLEACNSRTACHQEDAAQNDLLSKAKTAHEEIVTKLRGLIGDAPVLDVLSLAYGNALDQLRKENVPSISQFSAVSIPTHSEPEPENCEPESLAQDLPNPQDDYDSISEDEDESIFNETFLIDENDLKDEKIQYGTRKRLKRILEPTELHQETLKAEKEEKERVRRLEDKAELHTQLGFLAEEQPLVDQQPQPLILDIDPVTREILVQVDVSITQHLKSHQLDGLRFLYNSTIESVDRLKMNGESGSGGSGCILAHKMGLGKTFQVIAFLHTIWNNRHLNSHLNRILIIVPYSVLPNWCFEFTKWTNICGIQNQVLVFQNFNETPVNQRPAYLETWYRNGGILLITIRLFQTLVSPSPKNLSIHPTFKKTLLNPGPDLLVIDEGHLLKNLNSAFHRSVCLVTTRRRIILTGTPLQNNLSEYYTMVSTVKPGLLGARAEFANRFEAPILNGQYANSTPYDVKLMSQRAHVLNRLLRETIHRVDERHGVVDHCCFKTEYVLHLRLSPTQDTLYRYFLEHLADKSGSRGALLYERTILGLIFAHPELLKSFYQRQTNRPLALTANEGNAWFEAFLPDTTTCSLDSRIRLSAKFTLAFAILQQVEALSEKLVIFSKEASTLCLFEFFLQSKNAGIYQASEWIPGSDYARIDGTVDAKERAQMIEQFNDSTNKRARLLLVSNRSGGIGISLVGARRCILLDVNWNPSTDQQAVYRLCRYGQKRPVVVYRFAAWDTIEGSMYNRQILKQSLANRVVDQQTINRHVNRTDENANIRSSLHPDLELNSAPSLPPMFLIPKDTLLGNLLLPYRHLIVTYTLHDSLLEDHPEEALTEAEQTEAWDAYQRETRDLSMNNSREVPHLSSPPPLRQAEPLPETESPQWKKDPICRPITLQTIQQFHCVGLDFFERMYEQLLPESYHGNLVLDMKKYLLSCVDFIQHYMKDEGDHLECGQRLKLRMCQQSLEKIHREFLKKYPSESKCPKINQMESSSDSSSDDKECNLVECVTLSSSEDEDL